MRPCKNRGGACRSGEAFSLIELLVVIAIIALLAALLFPSVTRAFERGRIARCQSNLHQMHVALVAYASDNAGNFPVGWTDSGKTYKTDKIPLVEAISPRYLAAGGYEVAYCPGDKTLKPARDFPLGKLSYYYMHATGITPHALDTSTSEAMLMSDPWGSTWAPAPVASTHQEGFNTLAVAGQIMWFANGTSMTNRLNATY